MKNTLKPDKLRSGEPQPHVRYIHHVPQQQATKKPPSALKMALVFFLVFTFTPAVLYLLFLLVMVLVMGVPK